ncbi:hypothetical protein FQN55_004455 [Onygenales sp. PD_40]|nr:hypothetical protein FQN55_004455 [Onygenales sp. PD_40]
MTSQIESVTLIGAGGNLGPSILAEFIKSSFQVTVLARETSTATYPPGVKVVKSDFSPISLTNNFTDQDAVVSIVGPEGFDDQRKVVDAAIAAGVKWFIPSEFGSDTNNPKVLEIAVMLAGKRKLVEYLETQQDKISWTVVIPGPFADWGIEHGFLQYDIPNKTAVIWDEGDVPVTQSTLAQIGRATVAVLEHPSETANQYVYISSYTATANDILAALESATGSKWNVQKVDLQEKLAEERVKAKQGEMVHETVRNIIRAACYSKEGYCDFRENLWNDRLGLKEESLEAVIQGLVE